MSGLPLPNVGHTQPGKPGKAQNFYRIIKTRRGITLLLSLALITGFYILDVRPLPNAEWAVGDSVQPNIVEVTPEQTSTIQPSKAVLVSEPPILPELEANQSYHLGSTVRSTYKAELEQFVEHAFPPSLHAQARASIGLYLGEPTVRRPLFEIPHQIYQTAKTEPNWDWTTSTWRGLEGYKHNFFDDTKADEWVRQTFGGTEIEYVWDVFGPGIKRADLLRYLLIMVHGGIYTDMDTKKLKDISWWGRGADTGGVEDTSSPSVFVGIEADVEEREDWHKGWPRPLQIAQWTFAASPLHPILIDIVRRVCQATAMMEARKNLPLPSKVTPVHKIGGEFVRDDGTIPVMEWTGPGPFTDSVIRYLESKYQTTWRMLKGRNKPVRIGDVVVLPMTGFSPGMLGAEKPDSPEAMVYHLFSGSWKPPATKKQ